MISAAIFDMDGTLVDSERLGLRAWRMAAHEMGLDIPEDLPQSFIGFNQPAVLSRLTDHLGDGALARRLFDRHWDFRRELSRTELEPKPGVYDALEALAARRVAMAVATSSGREITEFNLGRLGLRDYFACLTCGTEVERGKPDPEVFLTTAAKLGVEPDECIVVEDSANGVRAGHAAGMKVFLIPDLVQPTEEIEGMCYQRLSSLEQLPRALAAAGLIGA